MFHQRYGSFLVDTPLIAIPSSHLAATLEDHRPAWPHEAGRSARSALAGGALRIESHQGARSARRSCWKNVGFKWAIPVIAKNNSYNWDYFITYIVTHIAWVVAILWVIIPFIAVKGHNCRVNKQQDVERFSLGKAVWKRIESFIYVLVYRRV